MSTITENTKTIATEVPAEERKVSRKVVDAFKRDAEIREAIKALEAERAALKSVIDAEAQGAKYLMHAGVKVASRIDSHSQKVDYKTLAEAFPEAHAAVVSRVPYSYYRA